MTSLQMPICEACVHFRHDLPDPFDTDPHGPTCAAYPDGIPADILDGGDHRSPRAGDHGIQFAPIDDEGLVEMITRQLDEAASSPV